MCCFRDWSFTAVAAVVLNFTKWFYPEQEPEDKNVGKSPSQSLTPAVLESAQTSRPAGKAMSLPLIFFWAYLHLGHLPDFAPRVPGSLPSMSC